MVDSPGRISGAKDYTSIPMPSDPSPKLKRELLTQFEDCIKDIGQRLQKQPNTKFLIGRVLKGENKGKLQVYAKGAKGWWAKLWKQADFVNLTAPKVDDSGRETEEHNDIVALFKAYNKGDPRDILGPAQQFGRVSDLDAGKNNLSTRILRGKMRKIEKSSLPESSKKLQQLALRLIFAESPTEIEVTRTELAFEELSILIMQPDQDEGKIRDLFCTLNDKILTVEQRRTISYYAQQFNSTHSDNKVELNRTTERDPTIDRKLDTLRQFADRLFIKLAKERKLELSQLREAGDERVITAAVDQYEAGPDSVIRALEGSSTTDALSTFKRIVNTELEGLYQLQLADIPVLTATMLLMLSNLYSDPSIELYNYSFSSIYASFPATRNMCMDLHEEFTKIHGILLSEHNEPYKNLYFDHHVSPEAANDVIMTKLVLFPNTEDPLSMHIDKLMDRSTGHDSIKKARDIIAQNLDIIHGIDL